MNGQHVSVMAALRSSALFEGLSGDILERVAAGSSLESRREGPPTFAQGTVAKGFFIVVDGWALTQFLTQLFAAYFGMQMGLDGSGLELSELLPIIAQLVAYRIAARPRRGGRPSSASRRTPTVRIGSVRRPSLQNQTK